MIRRSTLIVAEVLFGLMAALLIGVGVLWWRLSQGPIELNFLREHVQAELSEARSGRPVGIERVELAWSDQGGALQLRAVGVSVEDGRGHVLSRSDEARIELAALPLLIGRISVERAEFRGGEISITRMANGAMQVAFGPPGAPPDIIVPPPPLNETLEQRVARMLDGMEAAFRPVGPGGQLREVAVRSAKLTIIDEQGGGRWTADAANLELARRGQSLALVAEARLEGAQGQAPATLRITTDTHFQSAIVEFGANNVRPRALFSEAALGPFAGLDAPFTATVSIGLDRRSGITRFDGDATLGRGVADMAGGRFDLSGGRFHGRYDIDSDEFIIDELQLAGSRTRVNGEVRVRDVSRILSGERDQPAAFNIALPSLTLDVPGTFAEPASFSNVEVQGAIVGAERSINFTRIHAQTGQGTLDLTGRIYWADVAGRPHQGIKLDGGVAGALDVTQVMSLWPTGLAEGARDYLARSLRAGRVTDAVVHLDIRPQHMAAGVLPNDAIDVRFNVSGVEMRFIETMSSVTNGRGSGILRGNSFEMTVPEARFNGMAVTNGRVDIPRLKPKGGMATISARVDGEARQILEVLRQEPLALGDRLPIDAATAQGRGFVNLRIQRPMLSEVPFEDWRFSVDGRIADFAGNMTTRRVSLANGQLQVHGDQRSITVSGPVRAGTSNVTIRWEEFLNRPSRASSEYTIAGDFDATDLERLGYPIATEYAAGRIGVTVNGAGRGFDVDNAQIELDLRNAAIEGPWRYWTKRAGIAASARFTVQRHRDGGLLFTNIEGRGGGLTTSGMIHLSRDNQIAEINLTRLQIEGRSDARLTALRAADGGLDVNVTGALFDAAPFMDMGDGEPAAGPTPVSQRQAQAQNNDPPVRAHIAVDRLKMRGGATLGDAVVDVVSARGALVMLVAEGRSPGDKPFSLALGPRPTDPAGHIRFRAEDAGFAMRALTGTENIVGGTATAEGDWRVGPPSQARFNVRLRDFQVVRLPAMARLLSSAGSLTGLVEMLNGDGIGFTALDAQMVYANNRVSFTEGRMAGPSLGLTGSGAYDIGRDSFDIDGVVAPSPGLNSMLGNVPLVGELFVSRRGEGVVGMTYSINGPAAEPRVGVNPLSALTPGILRRIFEPTQPRRETHAFEQREPETPPPPEPQAAPPPQEQNTTPQGAIGAVVSESAPAP
ncbi:DUF3971 domain-containing protein [Terricaulis sp.]|uniref:YhdP family protein n=1 Tax=Terricaulis sp. TaxID=2768686 RepID=UPI003782F50A